MNNTFKMQEQEFDTPESNNPKTELTIYCDQCKNPMKEWGLIHIQQLETTKQITFLCSLKCKKIEKKWIKFCLNCSQELIIKDKSKRNKKFCSVKCRFEHHNKSRRKCGLCEQCGNQIEGYENSKYHTKRFCSDKCRILARKSIYQDHYYCDKCTTWIKISNAVKVKNYFACPNYSCNKNKLRIRSRNAKLNRNRKQSEAKRIE